MGIKLTLICQWQA